MPKPSLLSAVVLSFVVGILVAGCSKPPEIVGDWKVDASKLPIVPRMATITNNVPILVVSPDLKGKFLGIIPITVGKSGVHGFFFVAHEGPLKAILIKARIIYKSGNRYRLNYYLKSPNNLILDPLSGGNGLPLIRMVAKNAPKN